MYIVYQNIMNQEENQRNNNQTQKIRKNQIRNQITIKIQGIIIKNDIIVKYKVVCL